jgi:hypothetical protein
MYANHFSAQHIHRERHGCNEGIRPECPRNDPELRREEYLIWRFRIRNCTVTLSMKANQTRLRYSARCTLLAWLRLRWDLGSDGEGSNIADKAGSKGSYIWSKMARIMCRSTIPHPRAMSTRMNVKYSNTFGGARKMVASLLTWTGDAWRMLTKIRPFGTSSLSLRWMAQWQCFAFSC